jgi:hypothetical protein
MNPTLQALSSIMVVDIDVLHFGELFCTLLAVLSRTVFAELSCKMSQTPQFEHGINNIKISECVFIQAENSLDVCTLQQSINQISLESWANPSF